MARPDEVEARLLELAAPTARQVEDRIMAECRESSAYIAEAEQASESVRARVWQHGEGEAA